MAEAWGLDARLVADSHFVADLALCQARLMDRAAWPWLVLVPRRAGAVELFDLGDADGTLLARETAAVARRLKQAAGADKINVGALGNIVAQLHVHVVARRAGDLAWPGPVWGVTSATLADADRTAWVTRLRAALTGL
ncbi:MAG: HIT domain-containing protein [Alphaproteobacteria bacterium]|nr:HIT domain-containing protein [Alphaproteobacteria bacterium]